MINTSSPAAAVPVVNRAEPARRYPRRFLISLISIPILVIGQFAMLAVIPVVLVVIAALRDTRLRAVRGWSIALGVLYATPLVIWRVRPDGAQSLSKDMSPVFVALITVAAAIVLIRMRMRKA